MLSENATIASGQVDLQASEWTMIPEHFNATTLPQKLVNIPPPGCLMLPYLEYLPWENPSNVVSARTEQLVSMWKDVLFLPVLFLIGGIGNVINMAVFWKQGLKERINVCLFALSLADFLYMLQAFLVRGENLDIHRKERYGIITVFVVNHNLIGLFGFSWVSQVISAIIASERCFCVLQPLRSHAVFRASTTTIIIVAVNIVMVGLYFVVAFRYRIACVYDPVRQVSFLSGVAGEVYLAHQKAIDYLDAFFFGVGVPNLTMIIVTVTTIVTMVKLREAAVWRSGVSSSASVPSGTGAAATGTGTGSGLTSQEIALTKMLVFTSFLFIVCVSQLAVFRFALLFIPDMNLGSRQHNLFVMGVWLLDIVTYINSTFNIFVYYSLGSRYRHTFWHLLGRRGRKKEGGKGKKGREVVVI